MKFDITTLTDSSFCFFTIDDTPYVVYSNEVDTTDGPCMLTMLSELGETPSVYDLCKKEGYTAHIRITDVIKQFLLKEYRLVSLSDEDIDLDAYRSKKYKNRFRTTPFTVDKVEEYFTAEMYKVYDELEDVHFYRFVLLDVNRDILVATAYMIDPESASLGKVFEQYIRKAIKVIRMSRTTKTKYMDNWKLLK